MKKNLERTVEDLAYSLTLYAQLQREQRAVGVDEAVAESKAALEAAIAWLQKLPGDPELAANEPDDFGSVRRLRPEGPRRLSKAIDFDRYRDQLKGAFLGRSAGCILGSPVEGWSIEKMESWASEIGDAFPPIAYWSAVPDPAQLRYKTIRRDAYTARLMNGIPVDDDLQYTLLGLLILEESGPEFTVEDVGRAWLKYLPFACTAEDVALSNLQHGVPARQAAASGGQVPLRMACYMSEELPPQMGAPIDNPYYQWIGADIRSDPWGYVAPGWPERAAEMAFRDGYVSHRRNGIYGEMFFSAAISAAFVVDDPLEALQIGLSEIPESCTLAREVRWALGVAPEIRSYREAHDAATERFPGMHPVHTINNACLTVWGINIGGTDLDRVISETVAMGFDNDCTAATAGSIVGAIVGSNGVADHWKRPFGNTIYSYLNDVREFRIDDVLDRFAVQMQKITSGR